MPTEHVIEQGESTVSVSEQYGFFARTIWNDSANSELKKKRKDMNVLLPGDKLVIPDKRLKEMTKASEKRHKFKRKGIPAEFRLQIFDVEKPRANQDYQLVVDGKILKGRTDGEGVLHEYLPANAQNGRLTIGPDKFECSIAFGELDPSNELVGVQKRLNNLGFWCGKPDGQLNDDTRSALIQFQQRFDLKVTGECDDATIKKLEEIHDQKKQFPAPPSHGKV